MRKMTALVSMLLLLFCTTTPQTAKAGGVFLGATEITQLLNHAELIESYVTQANQLATQLQQFQVQLRNATTLSSQLFGPIRSDLLRLSQVVQGGQSLSYSMANLDGEFANRYGGSNVGYNPKVNFANQYATWSQTSSWIQRKSPSTRLVCSIRRCNRSKTCWLVTIRCRSRPLASWRLRKSVAR